MSEVTQLILLEDMIVLTLISTSVTPNLIVPWPLWYLVMGRLAVLEFPQVKPCQTPAELLPACIKAFQMNFCVAKNTSN